MSSGSPKAVVAAHAGVAAALIDLVGRITGRAGVFAAVTNDGRDLRGVEEALRAALGEHGASVIFTDLPGGSVTMAARRIAHADPRITVITGVSAPMLLEFAMADDAGPATLERTAQRGREAVTVRVGQGPTSAD